MADEQKMRLLKAGVAAWNEWRLKNPFEKVDLAGANLAGAELPSVDLNHADLNHADLSHADLSSANLINAKLVSAKLNNVDFIHANLSGVNFRNADLSDAGLINTNLHWADLSSANLTTANLVHAKLVSAKLDGAKLERCCLGNTTFGDNDLSTVTGLETAEHRLPSTIGIDTFFRSKGKISHAFLRRAGVPDIFIQYAATLTGAAFESYSCFISYSTEDEEFASRLYNDFEAQGILCWKWDDDARTGRSLWGEIDYAIRIHDKLVLIASESSLKSPAVNREIERALVQEDQRLKRKLAGDSNVDCNVLFPVRLDDFIFKGWDHERKVDVTKKVVADACGWADNPTVYRRVLERLLRDLKSDKSNPDPRAK